MRITQHNRQQQKLTDELQEKLTKAVQKELSWLWRWVVRFLHKAKLNKAEVVPLEGAALWDEFQKRMHESLIKVIYSVDSLAIIERNLDFLISRGIDLNDFSTIDVMDGFIDTIADRVTLITVSTKKKIANRLARWYKTPGDSMQDVINDLKDTFGVTRAELIAQTEITEMDSRITDNMMQVLGDDVWWWETMRDQLVCVSRLVGPDGKIYRGCRELHGKRFQRGMNMPPKGSHPGCRCKAKIVHGVRLESVGQMPLRLSKADWVEQEHPRAEDGRFGTKSGSHDKKRVVDALRNKAKINAPVIKNKQIAHIARKHFSQAYATRVFPMIDFDKLSVNMVSKVIEMNNELDAGPDARNAFNDLVNFLRPYIKVSNEEYNRVLLNVRNRYYQKLRAAKLNKEPVEVKKPGSPVVGKTANMSGKELREYMFTKMHEDDPELKDAKRIVEAAVKDSVELKKKYEEASKLRDEMRDLYWFNKDKVDGWKGDKDSPEYAQAVRDLEFISNENTAAYENYHAAFDKFIASEKAVREAKKKRAEQYRKAFILPEDQQSKLSLQRLSNKKTDQDMDAALQWVSSVVPFFPKDTDVWMDVLPKGKRAYFGGNQVHVSRTANQASLVHEVGHWIEKNAFGAYYECAQFLRKRTVSDNAQHLGPGYGKGEKCKKDNFIDPYMGKLYPNATEILSMGLEYLFSKPEELAEKDPEYFDFIVDLIRDKDIRV